MMTYKEYVSYLSSNRMNETFLNSDQAHALDVFINLFNGAQQSIRIFAGCLTSEVSNKPEYISSISDFIDKGGELKVLLNKFNVSEAAKSDIIKRLYFFKSLGKRISIKKTLLKPYKASDPDEKEIHFTVVDGTAYRVETDVEERTAECNFNNPSMAIKLTELFDSMFDDKDSVDVDFDSLI